MANTVCVLTLNEKSGLEHLYLLYRWFSSSGPCVWAVHRVLGDFTCPVCSLLSFDLAISPHPTFPSPSYHALPLSLFTSLRGSPSINNAALSCHTLSRESVCVCVRVWYLFASTHKDRHACMHAGRHHALCTFANMCANTALSDHTDLPVWCLLGPCVFLLLSVGGVVRVAYGVQCNDSSEQQVFLTPHPSWFCRYLVSVALHISLLFLPFMEEIAPLLWGLVWNKWSQSSLLCLPLGGFFNKQTGPHSFKFWQRNKEILVLKHSSLQLYLQNFLLHNVHLKALYKKRHYIAVCQNVFVFFKILLCKLQTRLNVIVNKLIQLMCSCVRLFYLLIFLHVTNKVGYKCSYSNVCFSVFSLSLCFKQAWELQV